jgi:hypothetical protein
MYFTLQATEQATGRSKNSEKPQKAGRNSIGYSQDTNVAV